MSNYRSNQIGSRFTEPPVYSTPGSNLPNITANNSNNINSSQSSSNFSTFTNFLPQLSGITKSDLQKVLAQCNQPVSSGLSDNGTRDSLDSLRSNGTDTHPKSVDGLIQQINELKKERESHLKQAQTLQEKEDRLFLQLNKLVQGTNSGNMLPTNQELLNSPEPSTAFPSRSPPLATAQKPHKSSQISKTQIDPLETDEDVPEPPRKKPGPKSKTMPGPITPKKSSTESDKGIGKRPAPSKPSTETPTKKVTPVTTGVKQSRPAKITARKRTPAGLVIDNGNNGSKNPNDEISDRNSNENSQSAMSSLERPSISNKKDDSKQEASTSNQDHRENIQRDDATTNAGSGEPDCDFKFLERTLAQIESTDEEYGGISINQTVVPQIHPLSVASMSPGSPLDKKPTIGVLASTSAPKPQHDHHESNDTAIPPIPIKQEKIDPPSVRVKTEKE